MFIFKMEQRLDLSKVLKKPILFAMPWSKKFYLAEKSSLLYLFACEIQINLVDNSSIKHYVVIIFDLFHENATTTGVIPNLL